MKKAILEVIDITWPTIVIVICILTIMRVSMLFRGERKRTTLHAEISNLIFIVYLMILFRLVTSQEIGTGGGVNYIPFKEITRYAYGTSEFYKQIFGNILLFMPLGYYLTKYCKIRKLGGIILTSLLSSLSIEVVQHFIGRSFDVDDIILNVVGGILGYLVYIGLNAIKNHLPSFMRKDWFFNLIIILLIVVCLLFFFGII